MKKVVIVWNGQGGELDSVTVKFKENDDYALTNALIKLVQGNIITPGDSFEIEELE
jgi:formylmethanofuran dehydrogenase subunit B